MTKSLPSIPVTRLRITSTSKVARQEILQPETVVHFRRLAGAVSTKQGISPLTALAPEIWVDVNATAFSVHLLKQMGVAGMVITIKDQK